MGTINYGTSDYITLGFKPQYISDFDDDKAEIIAEMLDNGYEAITTHDYNDYVLETMHDYECEDYDNAMAVLEGYDFRYFDVTLEAGYYDGSYLMIHYDNTEFNGFWDKKNAYEEVDYLKDCLCELADIGMKVCYPSWCTSYGDYAETLDAIDEAMAEVFEDIRQTNIDFDSWTFVA